MPWTPKDAYSHTKRASTPALQRQWSAIANRVLESSGDEARAIREANAAVGKSGTQKAKVKSTTQAAT